MSVKVKVIPITELSKVMGKARLNRKMPKLKFRDEHTPEDYLFRERSKRRREGGEERCH